MAESPSQRVYIVPIKISQRIFKVAREDWFAVIYDADKPLEFFLAYGPCFGRVERIERNCRSKYEIVERTSSTAIDLPTLQNLVARVHAVKHGRMNEFFVVNLRLQVGSCMLINAE